VSDDILLEDSSYDFPGDDLPVKEGKTPERDFDSKKILVKMLDGTMVVGRTNLRSNTRLSDLLNRERDLFLVIFDAPFRGMDGRVVFVNKTQIMWAMPVEE
jgi:hypothetical protein